MANTTPTTKKPSGLSIKRSGSKFTFSWKKGSSYDSQQLQYSHHGKWLNASLGKNDTSKVVTLTAAQMKNVKSITFRVRGRDKTYTKTVKKKKVTYTPKWSSWVAYKVKFQKTANPSVSFEVVSGVSNSGKFSWSVKTETTDMKPFQNCEYQSILTSSASQPSSKSFNKKAKGWRTGTSGASGSTSFTESTTELAAGSRTRWLRVRAVGSAGKSDWRYSKHVYAIPAGSEVTSGTAKKNKDGTTTITVKWKTSTGGNHPVDKTTVQYALETPTASLGCPADASWSDGMTYTGARSSEAASFTIDEVMDYDECLFARVNTYHDNEVNYGAPKLILKGKLSDPIIKSVDVNTSTKKVTINAENNSDVPESYLKCFILTDLGESVYIGDIPNGQESAILSFENIVTENYAFAAQAVSKDGSLKSGTVKTGGEVPTAPTNVTATALASGSVRVTWDWSWESAKYAEISWSELEDAWESTDEPSTYMISAMHASAWNIASLEAGQKWYIRVRLALGTSGDATRGPWSDIITINLAEAPTTPTLELSSSVVTKGETITASWAYASGDGTAQAYAEICEAEVTGEGITYGEIIAHTTSAQNLEISTGTWETGTTHYLCVRATSASGVVSDSWSPAVAVTVAEGVTAAIDSTSLESVTIDERTVQGLTALPLNITTSGAGEGGTVTIIIERAADFHLAKPDETELGGFEGETIAVVTTTGDGTVSITEDNLLGTLDDGGTYRIIATVQDNYGQSASDSLEFEVHYAHQPTAPTATIIVEDLIVKITPENADAAEGDVVDIYRLSTDAPTLIISGGTFGETYVDPYPAFGENCGHRIVTRTSSGDYITAENTPAWTDYDDSDGDIVRNETTVVTYNGGSVELPNNVKLDNSWSKDFERTKYLGGSIEGDWIAGVTRDLSVSSDSIFSTDKALIRRMRRLANYEGICHIRTPEGSSFAGNVEVSESKSNDSDAVAYSLKVELVEPETLDGMTLAEWNAYVQEG